MASKRNRRASSSLAVLLFVGGLLAGGWLGRTLARELGATGAVEALALLAGAALGAALADRGARALGSIEDPTARWPRPAEAPPLVVDLGRHTLNGVPLGAPLGDLSWLGPCDHHAGSFLSYARWGLSIYCTRDRPLFTGLVLEVVKEDASPTDQPFVGRLEHEGRFLAPAELGLEALLDLLGPPRERTELRGGRFGTPEELAALEQAEGPPAGGEDEAHEVYLTYRWGREAELDLELCDDRLVEVCLELVAEDDEDGQA